jgi:hypothetical protein
MVYFHLSNSEAGIFAARINRIVSTPAARDDFQTVFGKVEANHGRGF